MSLFSDVFKREEEAGAAREAAKASRKELQRQLDATKEQNQALVKRAEEAETSLEAVRSALDDVDNQIDEVKAEMAEKDKVSAELQEKLNAAKEQNQALVKRAEDAEKKSSELQEQIRAMTEKAEELQEQIDAAEEGLKAFDRLKALLLMTDAERVEHFHTLELWAKEDDRIAGERSDYKKAFEEREHIRDTYMGVLDVTEIIALEK